MIKLPAYLTGFSSKADGSASLRFSTQELLASDFALLKEDLNEFGWLVFKPNVNSAPEIEEGDAEEGDKSPSKRLKAVLFVRWKQLQDRKETDKDFTTYYRMIVEAWIESVKAKLD